MIRATLLALVLSATCATSSAQIYAPTSEELKLLQSKRLDTVNDPPATVEGPGADSAFEWHVFSALGALFKDPSQMPGFEAKWRKWSSPTNLMRDGMPHVVRFDSGVLGYFSMVNTWDAYPKEIEALYKAWPNHPIPPLIKAAWHNASAWKARGTGHSNTVSKAGFERFDYHLKEIRKVLDSAPATSRDFPIWYRLKLLSWSDGKVAPDQLHDVLTESIRKFPHNPQPYFSVLQLFSPQWYGSNEQINLFMQWSLKHPLPNSKDAIYARLAWAYSRSFNEPDVAFRQAGIQWPRVRSGFDELMKRFPNSLWIPNSYAFLACRMSDRATFMRLKESIRVNMVPDAWTEGYSFEHCSAMLAKAM